jgi:hypothetical protein
MCSMAIENTGAGILPFVMKNGIHGEYARNLNEG